MKKIRCSLVMNPYDQIGRHMASDARNVFKQYVLKETYPWPLDKILDFIRIPSMYLKGEWINKILIHSPLFIAMFGLLFTIFSYSYDMYTDIDVILELEQNKKNFRVPPFSEVVGYDKNFTMEAETMKKFFFEKFNQTGLPALLEPCKLLDLIEEIPNYNIPFYKMIIGDIANIHWNPNKNNGTEFSDLFSVLDDFIALYNSKHKSTIKSQK